MNRQASRRVASSSSPGAAAFTVRSATLADLPAVNAIEREAFSDPWPPSSFTDAIAAPQLYFAVATSAAGTVVAYVIGWFVGGDGEIANIAVSADVRGQGIGGRLLDEALAAAQAQGSSMVHLEVRESNALAQALYASRGFLAVGRRRGYYREPVEDAIVLRKEFGTRED